MKRSVNITWAELKVGLVVMVGFVLFSLAILSFGTIRNFFIPRVPVEALFPNVKGLKMGAPVWLAGVEVGNVKEIRFPREGQPSGIRVVMEIDSAMRGMIKSDSTASIRTQGLLGDQYIEIALGSSSAPPLPPSTPLQGVLPVDIKELVSGSSETLEEISRFLKNISSLTSDQVSRLIQNLNTLITRMDQGGGTTGRLINDPSLYNDMRDLTVESRKLVKKLEESKGTAGKLIEDPELYDRLSATAAALESFSAKLEKGEGTLGKLASDEELYQHMNQAAKRLDQLMTKIESGEGVAGELIQDKELSKEMKGLVVDMRALAVDMRALVTDIKQNPKKYFKVSIF
jgi:phospholipid/cholesterol/gamma-HCH transport system substrate-binding protein